MDVDTGMFRVGSGSDAIEVVIPEDYYLDPPVEGGPTLWYETWRTPIDVKWSRYDDGE